MQLVFVCMRVGELGTLRWLVSSDCVIYLKCELKTRGKRDMDEEVLLGEGDHMHPARQT